MSGVRIAWFSPFPPVKTGIAGRSAELVDVLRGRGYTIDTYPETGAHDFPWRRRLKPYDLPVYQFGNSSHHDYEWPYALRYPGLVVLHDTHLHHARAALLLREKRIEDYRAEFRWNEPDASPDAAEIAIAGFDSPLYYDWPFVRALVDGSRLTAVHGEGARLELMGAHDARRIVSIRLGEGVPVSPEREARARREIRAKYGIASDAILFGCFGGLTPEKRIPQILAAFRALEPYAPNARLLLAGAAAAHFDLAAEIGRGIRGEEGAEPRDVRGTDSVTVTGYLETDDELTDHIAACDVTLNLRWPTARETSGPWLRALAAGKATVITDLVHMGDVPSFDPRTWCVRELGIYQPPTSAKSTVGKPIFHLRQSFGGQADLQAVCVAVDILDEDHSLRLAMRRLATDADLRQLVGRTAREYWTREHSVEAMADDYERVMRVALAREAGEGGGPPHLRPDGDTTLRELLAPFGIKDPF